MISESFSGSCVGEDAPRPVTSLGDRFLVRFVRLLEIFRLLKSSLLRRIHL
jgi:hypothetical protein